MFKQSLWQITAMSACLIWAARAEAQVLRQADPPQSRQC
jgi:hypothetical protein